MRLDTPQTEDPSRELGDLIEPGSSVEVPGVPGSSAGGVGGLEQLKGLRDSGLIDAETFGLIEATMTNPTAELDRLHASGAISDEIYAQALASVPAAPDSAPSADAADLDLLQHGESAPATVLTSPARSGEGDGRLLMTLEVHPAAGPPYEVRCAVPSVRLGGELKVGDFLQVTVDPDDPGRVAIDWTAFGT